jgi:hypothetical protein
MKQIVAEKVTNETAAPIVNRDRGAVEVLAYEFWLARGCPIGSPEVDWFHAEEELANQAALPPSFIAAA